MMKPGGGDTLIITALPKYETVSFGTFNKSGCLEGGMFDRLPVEQIHNPAIEGMPARQSQGRLGIPKAANKPV